MVQISLDIAGNAMPKLSAPNNLERKATGTPFQTSS
jgi:hypothetical protein